MKNYLDITQRYLKKPPSPEKKPPPLENIFIKISFLHKILSVRKLVPLICPGGAREPLLATRLFNITVQMED